MSCRIFSMIRVISRGYLILSMLESIFSFFFFLICGNVSNLSTILLSMLRGIFDDVISP